MAGTVYLLDGLSCISNSIQVDSGRRAMCSLSAAIPLSLLTANKDRHRVGLSPLVLLQCPPRHRSSNTSTFCTQMRETQIGSWYNPLLLHSSFSCSLLFAPINTYPGTPTKIRLLAYLVISSFIFSIFSPAASSTSPRAL